MTDHTTPRIVVGDRGEGLLYYRDRRTLRFTFHAASRLRDHDRLHVDGLRRWPNGEPLGDAEQERVLRDLWRFLRRGPLAWCLFAAPALVVYGDDPDRERWESMARAVGARVERAGPRATNTVSTT